MFVNLLHISKEFGSGWETALSEVTGGMGVSISHFSNLQTMREHSGRLKNKTNKKKTMSVEKSTMWKGWKNFFSRCTSPGCQNNPPSPATAIQTPCWSYFHWIIRALLPLTGLWSSQLSIVRKAKSYRMVFNRNFTVPTTGQDSHAHFRIAMTCTYPEM